MLSIIAYFYNLSKKIDFNLIKKLMKNSSRMRESCMYERYIQSRITVFYFNLCALHRQIYFLDAISLKSQQCCVRQDCQFVSPVSHLFRSKCPLTWKLKVRNKNHLGRVNSVSSFVVRRNITTVVSSKLNISATHSCAMYSVS